MSLNLTIYMSLLQNKTQEGENFAAYRLHLIPDNVFDESIFSLDQTFALCLPHGF